MKKFSWRNLNWSVLGYFLAFELVYWTTKLKWNEHSEGLGNLLGSSELAEIVGMAVSNVNAMSLMLFIYIIFRVGK